MNHERIGHTNDNLQAMTLMSGRVLQRKCGCGQHMPGGGACVKCRNAVPLHQPLQTKLQIGEANDRYEQEADRIADQVVRMPRQVVSDAADYFPAKPLVQRRLASKAEGRPGVPAIVQDVLGSSGHPLDTATRAYMEPRFGVDFSQVRVHDDNKAGESADAVNAKAYTVGQDIVFQSGSYSPGSTVGKRLLAHELVHTAQQSPTAVGLSHETVQRVAESSDDELGEELASASRVEGLLRRWALNVKRRGAVEHWITRLEEGKVLALRRLRVKRARRVLLLASQNADLETELEESFLKQLARFIDIAEKQPTTGDEALEESSSESDSPPEFSLTGVPTATLEPQLRILKGADLLVLGGVAGMDKDFAIAAPFEASGSVTVTGGTDDEVSQWEAGFLQTVIGYKTAVRYLAAKPNCFGWTTEMPSVRDGLPGATPPWYGSETTKSFVKSGSAVHPKMTDAPSILLKWQILEQESIRGVWGPLDVSCGVVNFGTWLVARRKGSGEINYLYSWQWAVDFSADFYIEGEAIKPMAKQSPPIAAEGKGSLDPVLEGPVANTMAPMATRFVPWGECQPCEQM